ncbi:MAG TPA: heparinase II/III-family protein, partial [Phnomibacter sp.]|nr:heparinase II/III-family protein [Phnomibacter sp.]
YAILRDAETISFIRCGSHKDRPAQADNLHLDVWIGEQNVLHDAGSYQYNTTPDLVKYFMGTTSHNTVMLGHHDQMLKGSRFIWYHWTQAKDMQVGETEEYFTFRGNISCFGYLASGIVHERVVKKKKGANEWWVEDSISNKPSHLPMRQLWHKAGDILSITVKNKQGENVALEKEDGWISRYYGVKQPATMRVAETKDQKLTAHIVA